MDSMMGIHHHSGCEKSSKSLIFMHLKMETYHLIFLKNLKVHKSLHIT